MKTFKKIILVMVIGLFSLGVKAQTISPKFQLDLETKVTNSRVLQEPDVKNWFTGRTYNIQLGCRFFDGNYIGIGSGFNIFSSITNIPIYMNYRYYIDDLERIVIPFVSVSAGYDYACDDEYSGAIGDIAIGADILLDDNTSLYIKLGLDVFHQYDYTFLGPGLSVGFSF